MRLLANADQTSARGQRDPLKGIHTAQGKLLMQDFEITTGLTLFYLLFDIGYIKETVNKKDPLTKTHSAPIKKRRRKPYVFRSLSTGALQRPREPFPQPGPISTGNRPFAAQ